MKRTINILLIFLFACCSLMKAQTKPEERKYEELRYWRGIGTNEMYYTAVKIGEYYWINTNMKHQKAHQYGPDWHIPRYEVTWATEGDYQTYLDKMKLKREQVPFTMDQFNDVYGAYYHEHSIYGRITPYGVFIARMDDPNEMSLRLLNPTYDGMSLDEKPKNRRYDLVTKSDYRTAKTEDWKQLMAMVPLKNKTLSLDVHDVRGHLSTKRGENPLAYDYWTDDYYRTYWFEIAQNSFGFNMMPGGGRVDHYKTMEMDGYGELSFYRGDFYQMFHVAKYATGGIREGNMVHGRSLDIEDYIHFYPNTVESLNFDNGTWYNVRFCRPLTVEELGYRLFYNNDKKKPNIVKRTTNLSDPTAPTGYTELENGYLRGFYVARILDNPNPKYTLEEVVKMADCVIEYDHRPDSEECACNPDYYLTESMMIQTEHFNSHTVYKNKPFTIIAPNNSPENVHIGLFDLYGRLIEKIDIEGGRNGDAYECKIVKASRNQQLTIQAFYNEDDNGLITPREMGRILTVDYYSHLVDELHVNYLTTPQAEPMDDSFGMIGLTGHARIQFIGRGNDTFVNNIYEVEQEEEFAIIVPYDATLGVEMRIGLYSVYGDYINRIDYDVEAIQGGRARKYLCKVPYETLGKQYLYPGEDYIVIPYYVDNNDAESENTVRRKINKHTHEKTYVDRLPIFVKNASGYSAKASPMSLKTEDVKLTVSIAPNPVTESFTIDGNFNDVLEVHIYGLSGSAIKVVKNSKHINIGNLPLGIYKVRIVTDKGEIATTIMKK